MRYKEGFRRKNLNQNISIPNAYIDNKPFVKLRKQLKILSTHGYTNIKYTDLDLDMPSKR